MKGYFSRAAAFLAAVLTAASLWSCSGKASDESSSASGGNMVGEIPDYGGNVGQDELPYGATISKLSAASGKTAIDVEYDNRFLTEEEAAMIADYLGGLSLRDTELFESAVYPALLKNSLSTMNMKDTQALLDDRYDNYKKYIGDDFEFTLVTIDDVTDGSETGFASCDEFVEKVTPGVKAVSKKELSVNCLFETAETGGTHYLSDVFGDDLTIYVYTIDGRPYVIS